MVFVAANAFSQTTERKEGKMLLLQKPGVQPINGKWIISKEHQPTTVKQVIEPNFYVTNLGFFCKQEIKFEKATKIPFRFRLGSVEDCDRMEGKHRSTVTIR